MREDSASGNGSKLQRAGDSSGTVGHISSAGCKGQEEEVVTLAHNNVFRDLMFDASSSASTDDECQGLHDIGHGEDLRLALGTGGVHQYVQQSRPVGGCG